MLAIKLTKAIC